MPVNTRGATAVYQGGKILVLGNTNSDSSTLQIYDIASQSWAVQNFGGGRWEQSATVGANGKVYVFGGEADTSSPPGTNTTLEYDPATGTTAVKAIMPVARKQHESGLIDGAILVVGGNASFNLATGQVDRYDPQADSWSTAPADLANARLQFAGGVLGNHFIVAGGSTENTGAAGPHFDSVEVYDPLANVWTAGPSLPEGLRESAGAVSGDYFYVLGGFQSGPSLSQEVYRVGVVPEPSAWCGVFALAAACGLGRRLR
jgi:N-acetylneuraminic acid mutarotase